MKLIAVHALSGGAGASTVTALLAMALAVERRPVLALDLSPDNLLRLHFGMAWSDPSGLATQMAAGHPWHEAAYRSQDNINFIPFGDPGSALDSLSSELARQPNWLARTLSEVALPPDTWVLCDCPRFPGGLDHPLTESALQTAELVLLVASPDPRSALALPRVRSALDSRRGCDYAVVLNCFDASRTLDRDILSLLNLEFADCLAPVTVHRDEAIREAFACKSNITAYAPSSQAVQDFSALATWLIAHTGHSRKTA